MSSSYMEKPKKKKRGQWSYCQLISRYKMEKYNQEGCSKIPCRWDALRENVKAWQQRLELPEDRFVVKLQFGE